VLFNLVSLDVGGWCYVFSTEDRFVLVEGAFEPALLGETASLGGVSHGLPRDSTFDAFVCAPLGAHARELLRVKVDDGWLLLMSSVVAGDELEKLGPWTGRRNRFDLDTLPKVAAPAIELGDGIGGSTLAFRVPVAAYRLLGESEQRQAWGFARRLVLAPE
jgi:hypothetical protein